MLKHRNDARLDIKVSVIVFNDDGSVMYEGLPPELNHMLTQLCSQEDIRQHPEQCLKMLVNAQAEKLHGARNQHEKTLAAKASELPIHNKSFKSDYRLERQFGQGNEHAIYKVTKISDGTKFAVKHIKYGGDSTILERSL